MKQNQILRYYYGNRNKIFGLDIEVDGGTVVDDFLTTVFYSSDVWQEGEVVISSKDVLAYFSSYNASSYSNNGEKICGYSPDLFDLGKSNRYVVRTSNINDTFSLDSYMDTHNIFEKWFNFGLFNSNEYNKTIKDAKYIEFINSSSFIGSGLDDRLLIQEEYIDELQEFYNNVSNENNVYLLRFAYSDDYYTCDLDARGIDGNFMLCQSNVYLDFDFIEFGFGDETDLTIIPAVSDPIDVILDIIPTDPDIVEPEFKLPGLNNIIGDDHTWIIVLAVILIIFIVVIIVIGLLKNPGSVVVMTDKIRQFNNKRKKKKSERAQKKKEKRSRKRNKRTGDRKARRQRRNFKGYGKYKTNIK